MGKKQEFKIVSFPRRGWYCNPRLWGCIVFSVFLFVLFGKMSEAVLPAQIGSFGIGVYLSYVLLVPLAIGLFLIWRLYWRRTKINANRQKQIQYFISANNLYEVERYEAFKDGRTRQQERVKNYAVFAYYEDDNYLAVRAYKEGDIYSERMSSLDSQLSALFKLPLDEKFDTFTHCDYLFQKKKDERLVLSTAVDNKDEDSELVYNASTIIPLNSSFGWNVLKQPHGLVAGVTGSGKSTFIFYILTEMLKMEADVFICDPKSSDLGSLKHIMGEDRVASEMNQIARVVRETKETMQGRYKEYKDNPAVFKFGASYVEYGLSPVFLIFDEVGAFRAGASKQVYSETMAHLTEIILKGREMGVFVLLATQQPNSQNIPTELRDSLSLRLAMGNMSAEGYRMVFGALENELETITTVGGAYLYLDGLGWNGPKKFETPYVDYGNYDFAEQIKRSRKFRQRP